MSPSDTPATSVATPLQAVAVILGQMHARLNSLQRESLVDWTPELDKEMRDIVTEVGVLEHAGARLRALTLHDAAVQAALSMEIAIELKELQVSEERMAELGHLIKRAMASVLLLLRDIAGLDLRALGDPSLPWSIAEEFPSADFRP